MDKQARKCINCTKYDTSGNCAKDPVWVIISDPKAHWCDQGAWTRWEEARNRYQMVSSLDDILDMCAPKEITPIYRPIETSMVVVPEGKEVTFDGRIVEKQVRVETGTGVI